MRISKLVIKLRFGELRFFDFGYLICLRFYCLKPPFRVELHFNLDCKETLDEIIERLVHNELENAA